MPHRAHAGENSLDARLESTVGRFFFHGLITEAEFQAGVRYGEIILDYLRSIDAPAPYGNGFEDIAEAAALKEVLAGGFQIRRGEIPRDRAPTMRDMSDDECFKRKILAAQSRQVLKDAAHASKVRPTAVITAVDRLTVYGEPPRGEKELEALRIGLRALAHGPNIIPFGRPARPYQGKPKGN